MAVTKRFRGQGRSRRAYYQAEVYVRGVRLACRSFDTSGAAHSWHDVMKACQGHTPAKQSALLSVREVVERYKLSDFLSLRKSSQQSRRARLAHILESPIAEVKLSDLNPEKIDQWLSSLKQQPTSRNVNRYHFGHELRLLRRILNWFKEKFEYEYVVPITKQHYRLSVLRPKVATPDRFLDHEQLRAFLQEIRKHPDPVYFQLAYCMALTGLRLGEAAGLCWDCVDLEGLQPSIRVMRTLSWDYSTKEPYFQECAKTEESVRYIPIDQSLATMFAEMRAKKTPTALELFSNRRGRLLSDNSVRVNFNRALKAIGVRWRGTHILRHSFATIGLQEGGNLSIIQASLGHRDQKTTQGYAKVVVLRANQTSMKVAAKIGPLSVNHGENHGGGSSTSGLG